MQIIHFMNLTKKLITVPFLIKQNWVTIHLSKNVKNYYQFMNLFIVAVNRFSNGKYFSGNSVLPYRLILM